jgi:hypothetical protein
LKENLKNIENYKQFEESEKIDIYKIETQQAFL